MRLTTVIICICSVLFVTSCENKSVSETTLDDYGVKKKTGPLSDEEIRTCFSALGLSIDRLSIMMPERKGIRVTSEMFENGSSRTGGTMTTYLDAGLQDIIIFKIQEDNKIKFSFYNSGGRATFSQDLKGYGATTSSMIPVKTITPQKQPIYFFAANEKGIEGYSFDSSTDFDVEDFSKKYEFGMVIYAELKEPGSETRENKCGTSCAN